MQLSFNYSIIRSKLYILRQFMNRKGGYHNVKNVFSETITSKCMYMTEPKTHIVDQIFKHSTNSNSSMQISDKSCIQSKAIRAYADDLIKKINYYRQKSANLFRLELNKYQSYYRQIQDMIKEYKNEGKHKIESEQKRMMKIFEDWREKIILLVQELQVKYYDYDYEEKVQHLQKYTRLQVDKIQIRFPDISSFNRILQKYLLSTRQLRKENKQNDQAFITTQTKEQKQNMLNKDKNTQAALKNSRQDLQYKSSNALEEPDDLLGCDEQLGAKTSSDTIRRRKYEVGMQNVIKEEDESDQTNSIVSDC